MGNKDFEPDLDEVYGYFQELVGEESYSFESREASMELKTRISRTPIHGMNRLFFDMRDQGYLEYVEKVDLPTRSFKFDINLDGDDELEFTAEDLKKELEPPYLHNPVSSTQRQNSLF